MRSDDEDDEDDFDEENDEEEDDGMDGRGVGINGDADEEDGGGDREGNGDEASSEAGYDDDNQDEEGDGDDDEDEDDEGDGDGDDDDDEDDDDENDDEDDEDDQSEDDEADDVDIDGQVDGVDGSSSHPSHSDPRTPAHHPPPPHLIRRTLFTPAFTHTSPPSTLSIEAIVGIPLPSAVHAIASTTCSSYLLTGSQDGNVRCYDFWSSVNGSQVMTGQQRGIVGLGEGVNKGGVGKGWWSCEVDGMVDGAVTKRREPIFSLACEGDGLWALAGTQSGPINMYTLRHSPGSHVYTLKGHTNVVSCMALLPNEKGLLSGSWDGTVREWDLNTGQTVRTYPTHGAQLSSLALRPFAPPNSPSPSTNGDHEVNSGDRISISMGPDLFEPKSSETANDDSSKETLAGDEVQDDVKTSPMILEETGPPPPTSENDIEMAETKSQSSYDPLFDEDAEGEEVPPSGETSALQTPLLGGPSQPASSIAKPSLTLALPSNNNTNPSSTSTPTPLFAPPQSAGMTSRQGPAAATIPLLSPTTYRAFSDDILLTSSMDGQVVLIDRRVSNRKSSSGAGVGRLLPGERAPPWCMSACWSSDGSQVLAGRRNGTVDIWDVRKASTSSSPNLLRTLKTPPESGAVSCVVAFPDGRHVATASQDNIRLWNTAEYFDVEESSKRSKSRPPFKIIAGHHGGTISSMIVDPTCRFLITASGDRGWQGESTRVVLIHDIKW